MAQIIPPITSLPIDSLAAPSAEDIQDRLPSICVDYLSHDWSEEDVWASWRSMTRHKHEIANGVRLENASWRTWNKQRNNLKTISPETLNWLKDSDVTWLYGPLHTANVEPVRPMKVASADERIGLDRPTVSPRNKTANLAGDNAGNAGANTRGQGQAQGPSKPILKHRTLSEMLTIAHPTSPILEASSREDSDYSSGDENGPPRPSLLQTKSDTNIANSRTSSVRYRSPPRMPISGKLTTDGQVPVSSPPGDHAAPQKKHISFNTFVEQCQAISDTELPLQQSDSEDDMLEIRSNSSRSSRSSRPSLSRNSSSGSGTGEHLTIAMIAPTMLKTNGSFVSSNAPQMVYAPPPEYRSPAEEQPDTATASSPTASTSTPAAPQYDIPSPQIPKRDRLGSDDEDYGSAGYDYFGGPDLGNQQASHTGSYGRQAPTVGSAPAQPKWRQPSVSAQSSEPSSVASSSSGSINLVTSPPVPSRGILKVRPPGSTPPEPASPPQSSYFNYNPSPATGIGGMRGSYEYASTLEENHRSPIQSPATEETRGRSAQRHVGSAAFDRSASRGTSTSSTSTTSARTPPVDGGSRRVATSPIVPSHTVSSPPVPSHTNIQAAAPVVKQASAQSAPSAESNQPLIPEVKEDVMDVDEPYEPERSNTPTPHSSPQISFRPLKDTSPASLPHNTTSSTPARPTQPRSSSSQTSSSSLHSIDTATMVSPELPKADPPTLGSPQQVHGARATIAHTGGMAYPTISQPPLEEDQDGSTSREEVEGDGSSIMGRAANIANSARGLIGSFWYGGAAEGGGGQQQQQQQQRGISQGAMLGGGVGGQGMPGGSMGGTTGAGAGMSGAGNALSRQWSGGKHKRGMSLG